ncbi:MAG: hypothetical protein WCI91_01230 [Candidatus Nomurabacteria bacterium]
MKSESYKKIAIGTFIVLSLLVSKNVLAFEKSIVTKDLVGDFVVEPGKTEIYVNPGETSIKAISITNRIDKTTKFKLTTEDMVGTSDPTTTVKLMGDEKSPYSLKNFIIPEISEFSLEPGEKITIPVTVSIPIDSEPRGFYGALIVSNEPTVLEDGKAQEAEGKARLVSRIGALFLLRINGEGKESGSLTDFKIIGPKKVFYENRPKGFEIAFKNDGNVHLVPHGKVIIKNILGGSVGEIPVDAYFALPDSTRYREVLWSEGSGLGRYTANLSLYKGYGSENDNATASIVFWIIPWKILLAIFAGLVIFISFIYYILTRFELKKKK